MVYYGTDDLVQIVNFIGRSGAMGRRGIRESNKGR